MITDREVRRLTGVLLAVVLLTFLGLSWNRFFDCDEFETIKAAWKIHSGERIYIDFFEHHHPLFFYGLSLLFPLFGESAAMVHAARTVTLALSAGILAVTYAMAALIVGRAAAPLSVLLLTLLSAYGDVGLDVRPDVPMAFFALLSILWLFRHWEAPSPRRLIASALAGGVSFLCLQKAVWPLGVLLAFFAVRVARRQSRIHELLLFMAVLAAPWAAYAVFLWMRGDFGAYWFLNCTLNLHAPPGRGYRQLPKLLRNLHEANALVVFLFAAGALLVPKNRIQKTFALLAVALLAVTLGWRIHFEQYYLTVMPLMAVLAAHGFRHVLDARPPLAALALLAASIGPLAQYGHNLYFRSNARDLELVEYVRGITDPTDCVYDGELRCSLFRKDLDFFWFSVGPRQQLDKYRSLRDYPYDLYALIERRRPKVIVTSGVPDPDDPRIRAHYRPSPLYAPILVRMD
jgi:4-amino-4-deoxy-L-arabinose transferase-like glycosyltransferase